MRFLFARTHAHAGQDLIPSAWRFHSAAQSPIERRIYRRRRRKSYVRGSFFPMKKAPSSRSPSVNGSAIVAAVAFLFLIRAKPTREFRKTTHTHTQVIFIYIWCHTLASRVCSCDKRGWFNPKFSPYGSGVYVPGGMLDGSVLYII